MARESGLSHTTVRRIWAAFSVQPHRSETFKLSSDPLFVDKVRDIVGLYLSPPDRALVLCVDEKSQIQALDRTQPVLPMLPGMPERRTHDYKRHGTTSLFAALDVATGFVIGKCYRRHRAREFLDFLKEIDRRVPEGLDIHIVRRIDPWSPVDNIDVIQVASRIITTDQLVSEASVRFLQDSALSGDQIGLEVSLSAVTPSDLDVVVTLAPGSGDNPAVPGVDYIDEPISVTIQAGTSSTVVTVQLPLNADLNEARSLSATVTLAS